MLTVKEFQEKLNKVDPIGVNTNDVELLNSLLGFGNWMFTFETPIVTTQNLVILKGVLEFRLEADATKESKKKTKEETENKEDDLLFAERIKDIVLSGTAVVNLTTPFELAMQKAIRRARRNALGQLGLKIVCDDAGDELPMGRSYNNYSSNGSASKTESTNVVKEERKETQKEESSGDKKYPDLFCEQCKSKLETYDAKTTDPKTGKPRKMYPNVQATMTKNSYGKVLCRACNAKAYASSKN